MRALTLKILAFAAAAVMTSSCLHAAPVDNEKMLGLAVALTKVTPPVSTSVRYKNPPADLQDGELLAFAMAHNPSLLTPFDGYVLKARQSGRNSSVLVCDRKGQIALIEDTACTEEPDLKIWQTNPNQPCDYALDLAKACAVP